VLVKALNFSVMLAAKFFDDQYYNNAYYAQIGGVSVEEINTLEVEFLFMINFSLFATRETFYQYDRELQNHIKSGCSCQTLSVDPRLALSATPSSKSQAEDEDEEDVEEEEEEEEQQSPSKES